ncbi:protein of unknown function DUF11, partial [Methanophagales archaeon]
MMKKKNDVAFRLTGFVLIAGLIAMVVLVGTAAADGPATIYGSREMWIAERQHIFEITDDLYGYGDFGDYSWDPTPCPDGCGGRVYVVNHQETWTNGTPLYDVSKDGKNETVSYDNLAPGYYFEMVWPTPLTPGTYDLILDLNVSGYPYVWTNITNPYSGSVYMEDPVWTIYVNGSEGPGIEVKKTANPTSGAPSTNVNFSIVVTNTGDCRLNPVKVVDTLPTGMSYVSSSPVADSQIGTTVTWNNLGSLSTSESRTIYLIAHIDVGASGTLNNTANATGKPPAGDNVSDDCYEEVTVLAPAIQVTKVASPSAGAP